jgi:hypothetical protein
MVKIYCPNKDYNGISATVNFVNGVGFTDDSYLIQFFKENGYIVADFDNMTYKELQSYAKFKGFNSFGLKQKELINKLKELEG